MKSRIQVVGLMVVAICLLSACTPENVIGVPQPRTATSAQVESGRALIAYYGCGSCHTVPGVPGAQALAAPPLDRFYQRVYIAGELPNTEENLIKWINDPQSVEAGTAMPNLGVSREQARDMAAYLYHRPTLLDWFRR